MSNVASCVAGNLATVAFASEFELHTIKANPGPSSKREEKPAPGAGKSFKEHRAADAGIQAQAEKVLRAFNTWSFKREQPSDPQLMLRFITDAIATQAAIPFVLYWGKGPRHETGTYEIQCLEFLSGLAARVRNVYAPGAAIKLILTDTHAELNGHSRANIRQYFDDVTAIAGQRGFETCWLGDLVKAAGNLAAAAPLDETVSAEMLGKLIASAEKWYNGGGTVEEGALRYLRMNLIEQRVVERTFPGAIFVTFNGSELRGLFPRQLPIFYMYSLRRGMAVKPWFLPAEPKPADVRADPANLPRSL
jgi:L-tyrosine isonitrile synthase